MIISSLYDHVGTKFRPNNRQMDISEITIELPKCNVEKSRQETTQNDEKKWLPSPFRKLIKSKFERIKQATKNY